MTIQDIDRYQALNQSISYSSRFISLAGYISVILFVATIGVWAVTSTLSGAVVAPGVIVVDGSAKKIQHSKGGTVGGLFIREGDTVKKNQILVKIDDSSVLASLKIIEKQLDEYAIRRARLEAELGDKDSISVPAELTARMNEKELLGLVSTETNLLLARRNARAGQQEQLGQQIEQLLDQIDGIDAQEKARQKQEASIKEEHKGASQLYEGGLITLARKATLDRAVATIESQKGQFAATTAQIKSKIAETKLQIIQIGVTLREEVLEELREIQSKSAELMQRRIAVQDELQRMDLRSPIDGRVHELVVHTVGGVISPAETVMLIVPIDEDLQIEARISPTDIDQIEVGRQAEVKLRAFNQRTTPLLFGKVEQISPDTTQDPQGGGSFYTVLITLDAGELDRIAPNRIGAGMQAEVFVTTEDRTPLEFFLKPIQDQFARAFRER